MLSLLLLAITGGPWVVASNPLFQAYQDELEYRMGIEAKRFDTTVALLCGEGSEIPTPDKIGASMENSLDGYSPDGCVVYSIKEISIKRAGGVLNECIGSFRVEAQGVSKRFELRNIPPTKLDFSKAAIAYRVAAYRAFRKCAAK